MENNFLTLKDDNGRIHISAVLFDFLRQMSETRKIFDGNNHWYSGYDIPFPVVSEENKLPHYTFYKIKLVGPTDNTDDVCSSATSTRSFSTNSVDRQYSSSVRIQNNLTQDKIDKYLNLRISSLFIIPTQLCCGKYGIPLVTPLINQVRFSYEQRDSNNCGNSNNNFLFQCAKDFYSNIWNEHEMDAIENLVCEEMRNLRNSPAPKLRNFVNDEVTELVYVDWIFQMHLYCSKMSTFCCEMITLAFPFCKNEISVDIEFMYQNRSAIIVMDQALINIYEEAISDNNTLQATLPDRYSYNSVNELVQAIESIILPQSPHAIAHRQFLFQTITQNEGESTSDLMQRIYAYLRMFEYTLRPKDCVELIACMNAAFKHIYLFEQARNEILTKARNNALNLELLLRNIGEAEMARKVPNGGVNAVFSARNIVHMGQVECK